MDALQVLARARYVLLTTFRKDGTPVPTPVWCVGLAGGLGIWTAPGAGKVKRVKRDGRVLLVPCSVRGRPIGASVEGNARLLTEAELPALDAALIAKYGIQMHLASLGARLQGRRTQAGLGVTVHTGWARPSA